MRELIDRMRALEHHVMDASAARRVQFAGGVAYFNDELPAVWDLNLVRLDRDCREPAAEMDRLQAGLGHRKVLIEEGDLIERLGPGLLERGFGERRLVALARPPRGRLDPAARLMPCEALAPLRRTIIEERLAPANPSTVEQLMSANSITEQAGGRWLALLEGDEPVAQCVVFSYGGLAQIEDVAVLEAFQGRGLSRRLLEHALAYAAEEHDMAMIVAEAEDWPVGFYKRLGFEAVEERRDYLLVRADS